MRKLILSAAIILSCVGCVSQASKDVIARQAARNHAYVKKMRAGQTTPDQDKRFIEGNRIAWSAEDYMFNDTPLPADVAAVITDAETYAKSGR